MLTLLLIIIFISILILAHEWGHFYAARRFGVRVDEFGFGFPPRLFSRMSGGVRYSFNLFPFGGFVKIFGEHGEGEGETASFVSRPVWQRGIILLAGVGMNVMLAWFMFSIASALGTPKIADEPGVKVPVSVVGIAPDSPAKTAGLKLGDQILEFRALSASAREISFRPETEADVQQFIDAYRGEEIRIIIKREGEIHELAVTPRATPPEGEGALGIGMARLIVHRAPWYWAPIEGARTTGMVIGATASGLASLVTELVKEGGVSADVSGPVGIFFLAQDARGFGASYFLQFIGVLSVNLAVLNALPIPALDGGRVFFLLLEKIRRARMDPRREAMIHGIGFALLVLLLLLVTYQDIAKLW